MREVPALPRAPRPFVSFLVSLAASSGILAMLLLWDHRVLQLRRARDDVRQLDLRIAEKSRENDELRLALEAAKRHEFPAEKVAREELQLVHPEDIVLLYPAGSLSGGRTQNRPGTPAPPRGTVKPADR
jgi:hypothetical protein